MQVSALCLRYSISMLNKRFFSLFLRLSISQSLGQTVHRLHWHDWPERPTSVRKKSPPWAVASPSSTLFTSPDRTSRRSERWRERETERQTDRRKEGEKERKRGRERESERQRERQTDRKSQGVRERKVRKKVSMMTVISGKNCSTWQWNSAN